MAQTRAPFHWKGTHDPLTTSLSHDILLRSHTLFLDRKWSEISDVAISLRFFFFSSTKLFFFQMNIFLFEYRQDKSVAEMMFSGSHQTQNFLCSCLRVVFPRAVYTLVIRETTAKVLLWAKKRRIRKIAFFAELQFRGLSGNNFFRMKSFLFFLFLLWLPVNFIEKSRSSSEGD